MGNICSRGRQFSKVTILTGIPLPAVTFDETDILNAISRDKESCDDQDPSLHCETEECTCYEGNRELFSVLLGKPKHLKDRCTITIYDRSKKIFCYSLRDYEDHIMFAFYGHLCIIQRTDNPEVFNTYLVNINRDGMQ
jgi:hypothetical protein